MTTKHPFAPASMIRRTVECPALRKCKPRSRAFASFAAMICAFRAALPTSWTSICGLSKLNWRSTASVSALIELVPPPKTNSPKPEAGSVETALVPVDTVTVVLAAA